MTYKIREEKFRSQLSHYTGSSTTIYSTICVGGISRSNLTNDRARSGPIPLTISFSFKPPQLVQGTVMHVTDVNLLSRYICFIFIFLMRKKFG